LIVLIVLRSQLAEFVVAGEELVSRSEHPADLLTGIFALTLSQDVLGFNPRFYLRVISFLARSYHWMCHKTGHFSPSLGDR
jgi:hypothetical protein